MRGCAWVCVCVCVCARTELGPPRDSHRNGHGFVIQARTVDPREDREQKRKERKNERMMERKLGGCQTLLKVFPQRLKLEDEDLE